MKVLRMDRGTDRLTKVIHIIPSPLLGKRLTKPVFVLQVSPGAYTIKYLYKTNTISANN